MADLDSSTQQIIELTAELAAKKAIGPLHEKINRVDKAVTRIEGRISVFPEVYESRADHDSRCSKRRNKILSLILGIPAVIGASLGVINFFF
jgi:hypothetical protein